MLSPKISTLSLGLLFTLTASADTSPHYKLRARVTGPKNDETPKIDGWAVEVQRLGVTTRLPPDYMWGVLINSTFQPSRGGDIFYALPDADGNSHVRTDAPNVSGEVTPFGFQVVDGSDKFPTVGAQMSAIRSITTPPETVTDIDTAEGGVSFLEKAAFEDATFFACVGLYQEWATLNWIDVGRYGTDPIYKGEDYETCTEVQLVPECTVEGPEYDGLVKKECVPDINKVL